MKDPLSTEMKLTVRQGAIISAYTGTLAGSVGDLHALAQELFGRPVWSHEFGNQKFADELAEKAKPLFLEICP